MSSDLIEQSKLSGYHKNLSQLVGEWEGATKVWFDEGSQAQESPIMGTMRLILDGRFILHEYQGSFDGKPLQGAAIYGYSSGKKQFECAWVDSFHNGDSIMFSVGKDTGKVFSVLGNYLTDCGDGRGEERWGWQTEIRIINKFKIVIRMDNISPDGKKEGGVETIYHRKKILSRP